MFNIQRLTFINVVALQCLSPVERVSFNLNLPLTAAVLFLYARDRLLGASAFPSCGMHGLLSVPL